MGNVFEWIHRYGHDEDFVPTGQSAPTDAVPGSREKLEVLRQRVAAGAPLWHPQDRVDFEGLEEAIGELGNQ